MAKKQKILVIVGPTASGKTSLGIQLAKRFDGEIISADSRQVYRGLDLGTGKVTPGEMESVPHHMLDVADPRETYTVADFVRDGSRALEDILSRGRLPIIVGGTFFYIDALLGKITLPNTPPNLPYRKELEKLDTPALYALLKAKDPDYAAIIDKDNPRRLIRALEIVAALGHVPKINTELPYEIGTLGLHIEKEVLHKNIHDRLIARIEAGMIEEVKRLHEEGLSFPRMEDLGLEYRYIARHLKGELPYCAMIDELETKSRQYAKRQMTWLKRDNTIQWVDPASRENVFEKVQKFLEV